MVELKALRKDHIEVLERVQLFEETLLRLLKAKVQFPSNEIMRFAKDYLQLFRERLEHHFNVEEQDLFPVLKKRTGIPIIEELLSEHESIMGDFHELENTDNNEVSFKLLTTLTNKISTHAKKEEELFSSIELDEKKLKKLDEAAIEDLFWWIIAGTSGGKTRARIVLALRERPASANQLSHLLGLDYKTIRYHLNLLVDNELLTTAGKRYGLMYFLSPMLKSNFQVFQTVLEEIGMEAKEK